MREIVTLQLGHFSNYVGTHFWNAQESYFTYDGEDRSLISHDVHWRPGVAVDGSETFLPRTVIYDLKGGFGSLRKINSLYDAGHDQDQSSASLWNLIHTVGRHGSQVVQELPRVHPAAYQESLDKGLPPPRLDTASVKYWSDFSRVQYHPRSLVQLYDYELDSPSTPFDSWQLGRDLFETLGRDEDIVDRDWRPFVEECDQMQAINVITTIDDAWGGFATAYLERLRDEYPKICIWTWGLLHSKPDIRNSDRRLLRFSNISQSQATLPALASTFVPLAVQSETPLPAPISIQPASLWHTSALLATGLETAALSSRLVATGSDTVESMGRLSEALNVRGNQSVAKLSLKIDTSDLRNEGVDIQGTEHNLRKDCVHLSNLYGRESDRIKTRRRKPPRDVFVFGSVVTSRGSRITVDTSMRNPNLERIPHRASSALRSINHACNIGFPLLDSFPQIYQYTEGMPADSPVNALTVLSSDTDIATDFKTLQLQASSLHGLDDRENIVNSLGEIADAYLEGWESDSNDDF